METPESTGERSLLGWVRRHRGTAGAVGGVALGLTGFLLYWFAPWQLFVGRTVSEGVPGVTVVRPSDVATRSPAEPALLSVGAFRSLEQGITGTAKVIELSDGRRFVRLEDLRTSNGPDLVVLLSDTPASVDSWGAYDDGRSLLLGELKGNIGDQNYEIPRSVDLARYRSVVVWCRRFTVGFGAAPLRL